MVSILKGGRLAVESYSISIGATLSIKDQGKGMNRKRTKFIDGRKRFSGVNTKADCEDLCREWVIKWQITFSIDKQRRANSV